METFLPNLLDWDVYSEVVGRVKMIRVCTELEKKMKGGMREIDSPAYQADRGDEYCVFTHPARSILDDGAAGWRRCPTTIDRIVGDMVVNGRTYCLPSRYYLGGKLLRPVGLSKRGMCVLFDIEEQEQLLAEMGAQHPEQSEDRLAWVRHSGWAKKKIYDYLAAKE